jgi:hypothetical protein
MCASGCCCPPVDQHPGNKGPRVSPGLQIQKGNNHGFPAATVIESSLCSTVDRRHPCRRQALRMVFARTMMLLAAALLLTISKLYHFPKLACLCTDAMVGVLCRSQLISSRCNCQPGPRDRTICAGSWRHGTVESIKQILLGLLKGKMCASQHATTLARPCADQG